jgi:hypothetical protein
MVKITSVALETGIMPMRQALLVNGVKVMEVFYPEDLRTLDKVHSFYMKRMIDQAEPVKPEEEPKNDKASTGNAGDVSRPVEPPV